MYIFGKKMIKITKKDFFFLIFLITNDTTPDKIGIIFFAKNICRTS